MTNAQKQLEVIQKQIASIEGKVATMQRQREQLQSEVIAIYSTRAKALRDVANGDTQAGACLDSLDEQEKNQQRRITGLSLLIDEQNIAIAKQQAEAAPILSQVQREHFHHEASKRLQGFDVSATEVESLALKLAEALAVLHVKTNDAFSFCHGHAEGTDYRNNVVRRIESLPQFVRQKVTNEQWQFPPPGELHVCRELTVIGAFPPAVDRTA